MSVGMGTFFQKLHIDAELFTNIKKRFFAIARTILPILKSSYVFYGAYAALLLLLFFAPITITPLDLYGPVSLRFGFSFPPLFLLPLVSLFVCASFFIKYRFQKDFRKLRYALIFASLSVYLLCVAFCVVSNANCFEWFFKIPFYIYFIFLLALVSHFYYAFLGIMFLRNKNPEYAEYKKLRVRRFSLKHKFIFHSFN